MAKVLHDAMQTQRANRNCIDESVLNLPGERRKALLDALRGDSGDHLSFQDQPRAFFPGIDLVGGFLTARNREAVTELSAHLHNEVVELLLVHWLTLNDSCNCRAACTSGLPAKFR